MPKGNRGPIGEVVMFPVDHPVEAAKTALTGVAVMVGSLVVAQASHIWAEHGGFNRIKPGE